MSPRARFQLARIFGIRIWVGVSWFFVLFLYILLFNGYFHEVLGGSKTTAYLVTVASVLSFFLSLILHELGHALVARRNGLPVLGIELWAMGGFTRTTGAVRDPWPEFRIAAAGPAVTLAIIVVSSLLGALLASGHHFFEVAAGSGGVHTTPAALWLSWLVTINALVLVLNLVPAFPLDGGQIAHALIWRLTGDRNRATRVTGRAGQGFALLLGACGLLFVAHESLFGISLLLIAMFVYQGASAAVVQGSMGQRIQSLTVADIMDREPVTIPAGLTVLDAHEQFFQRYRWPWFAVVDPVRHFLGVLRAERVEAEIAAGRPALPVAEVLEDDLPVRIDEEEPLESLLRSEGLSRLGAMIAVDGEGVLRGVVTVAQIRQALRPA
jgi:Zn-dependent protease